MPSVDTHAGPLGEVRTASSANGTALTTTAAFISLPTGTNYVTLIPRNAATAVVYRYSLNPYLIVFKTTDALAAIANLTEASEALQDGDTDTSLSMNSFGTFAAGDALFVGAYVPFRGVRVIIGDTNSVGASDLTVKYRKSDNTWATISATDGTDSTDTFRQTGNVYWTVPTDWIARSIKSIQDLVGTWLVTDMDTTAGALTLPKQETLPWYITDPNIYWTRWETSATFDSTVTATGMQAMNRSTTYAELPINIGDSLRVARGPGGLGCIEALTDAGTANLIVRAATLGTGSRFK